MMGLNFSSIDEGIAQLRKEYKAMPIAGYNHKALVLLLDYVQLMLHERKAKAMTDPVYCRFCGNEILSGMGCLLLKCQIKKEVESALKDKDGDG